MLVEAERVVKGIAEYMAKKQQRGGSFPTRDFYGLVHALSVWSHFKGYDRNVELAINRLKKAEKGKNFHWEFNNHALLNYYDRTRDDRVEPMLKRLKFRGTKVTNWTMLRAVCRLLKGGRRNKVRAVGEINGCLKRQKHGLFSDDGGVRSFQYHCFSTALIGEAYRMTSDERYVESFLKGVDFISNFILRNGDTLYIGRGQEQIFGYGCLIYILGLANALTGNSWYYEKSKLVLDYVVKFMRKDGSLPLVLRKGETRYPKTVSSMDRKFLGWYAYNNYFDYLAFFAYWLLEYTKIDPLDDFNRQPDFPNHPDFIVFRNDNYEAIVSRPGGRWTNDMPFPYVCYKGKSIFPCYGGEQFVPSLYSEEMIPLPSANIKGRKLLFRTAKFSLKENILSAKSRYFSFRRGFEFKENEIVIQDQIKLKRGASKLVSRFYFFEPKKMKTHLKTNGVKIHISSDYNVKGKYFCALGEIEGLELKDKKYELRVLLK